MYEWQVFLHAFLSPSPCPQIKVSGIRQKSTNPWGRKTWSVKEPEYLWPWNHSALSFPFEEKSLGKTLAVKYFAKCLEIQKLCKTYTSYYCHDESDENLILEISCVERLVLRHILILLHQNLFVLC